MNEPSAGGFEVRPKEKLAETPVSLRLFEKSAEQLEAYSRQTNLPKSWVIRQAVKEYLGRVGAEAGAV